MSETDDKGGCLTAILRLFGIRLQNSVVAGVSMPYCLRDDFLSPAERSFFGVLQLATGSRAVIFSKVRVADLLYVPRGNGHQGYQNRIVAKHVDFVLCDPGSMQPIAVIELDDASHGKADRIERDGFLESAFIAAGLPLIRFPAQRQYDVKTVATQIDNTLASNRNTSPEIVPSAESNPCKSCPKCGAVMVLRVANAGPNKGQQFYGCPNFPRCRGTLAME